MNIFNLENDGKSFEEIPDIKDPIIYFEMDPTNKNRAFAMTLSQNNILQKIKVINGGHLKLIFSMVKWHQFLKLLLILKIQII